jgi:hypothetical protein
MTLAEVKNKLIEARKEIIAKQKRVIKGY